LPSASTPSLSHLTSKVESSTHLAQSKSDVNVVKDELRRAGGGRRDGKKSQKSILKDSTGIINGRISLGQRVVQNYVSLGGEGREREGRGGEGPSPPPPALTAAGSTAGSVEQLDLSLEGGGDGPWIQSSKQRRDFGSVDSSKENKAPLSPPASLSQVDKSTSNSPDLAVKGKFHDRAVKSQALNY
jgi:hypothetical protein